MLSNGIYPKVNQVGSLNKLTFVFILQSFNCNACFCVNWIFIKISFTKVDCLRIDNSEDNVIL